MRASTMTRIHRVRSDATCCCKQNGEASMGGATAFTEKDTILAVKWCEPQVWKKFSGKLISMKYPSGN